MKNKSFKTSVLMIACFFSMSAVAQTGMVPKKVTPSEALLQQNRGLRNEPLKPGSETSSQNLAPRKSKVQMQIGGVNGGGGDAVTDAGGNRSLLDLVEKDSNLEPFKFRAAEYEPEFGHFVDELGRYHSFGELGMRILRLLPDSVKRPLFDCLDDERGLRWAFTNVPLEEIEDEGVIHLDNTESKRQVAIQIDGQVIVNRQEFNAMDGLGIAGLKLHEGLLCASKSFNPQLHQQSGTEAIRRVVRAIARIRLSPTTPSYVLSDAIKELMK